ncbi:MAG: hypothetical protein OES24_23330 [Acidimicrobiia bacterium]|nr:hypothetical protein [Acidimicrobiia bacterium]
MAQRVDLQTAVLDGGIEHVSFFNGRVLTAGDLQDLQEAAALGRRYLGQAIGPGVVSGLLVSRGADGTSVELSPGLAVNRSGEVLAVPDSLAVALVPTTPSSEPGDATFVTCTELPPSVTSTGSGVYLLTIGSAASTRDTAPRSDFTDKGVVKSCGPRYTVAGVQFRLIELDLTGLATAAGHDGTDLSVLGTLGGTSPHDHSRNTVAALLLDTVLRSSVALDPFGVGFSAVGTLDRLYHEQRLSDCEVPLALISWSAGAIDYVDVWSARRDPGQTTSTGATELLAGRGRQAEGLATYRQFQEQLGALIGPGVSEVDMLTLKAVDHFRYLPAAGIVPLLGASSSGGIDPTMFFDDLEVRAGSAISSDRVGQLLHASLTAAPIDVAAGDTVWTFPVEDAVDPVTGQRYVAFASDPLRFVTITHEEDSTRVVITGVTPPGDHEVGSEITVEGRNFVLPGTANDVTVGGAPVVAFNAGTTTESLVFNVPVVTDLPRVAPIVVSNANGTAEWLISVVERVVVPQGEVHFTEDLAHLDGTTITEGDSFDYHWDVELVADVAGQFTFRPVFTNAQGSTVSDWEDGAQVLDDTGAAAGTVTLEPADPSVAGSGPVRITIRVTVPVGATSVNLALEASSMDDPTDAGLNRQSSPVAVEVGQPPEVSDPRITFEAPTVTANGTIDPADGAVVIPVGLPVRVRVDAILVAGGTFTYAASLEPDDGGAVWEMVDQAPAPGVQVPDGAGSQEEIAVTLTPATADAATDRFLRFDVNAVDGTGTVLYTSFTRIRLRTS